MFSNSVVAAGLAACYVLILVLQLNPQLPLRLDRLAPIAAALGLFYVVLMTIVFFAILVGRRLVSRDFFSPAWLSLGVLSWFGAAAAAAGAALMSSNLRVFSLVLEPEAASVVTSGSAILVGCAALFALVALLRRAIGASSGLAICFAIVAVISIVAPIALRGQGQLSPLDARPVDAPLAVAPEERGARVVIVGIDAGSLELVTNAAAEGRLANFGRILD